MHEELCEGRRVEGNDWVGGARIGDRRGMNAPPSEETRRERLSCCHTWAGERSVGVERGVVTAEEHPLIGSQRTAVPQV